MMVQIRMRYAVEKVLVLSVEAVRERTFRSMGARLVKQQHPSIPPTIVMSTRTLRRHTI